MRSQPFWGEFEAVAHTLPYDGTVMAGTMSGRPLPTERWASVAVPTLVLVGGNSEPYQQSAVGALADLLPGARRSTLEGQTHDVAPEVLAPVLAEYFIGAEVER
jgi:pimeloyl-ACP methyl ester carboxylesterase